MEKNPVEEGMRKSKELGGSARRCYLATKICLEIEGCILGGSCLGSLGADLAPPEHSRVELTTFT